MKEWDSGSSPESRLDPEQHAQSLEEPNHSQSSTSKTSEPDSSQTVVSISAQSQSAADSRLPQLTDQVRKSLVSLASGDARTALSLLELVVNSSPSVSQDALLSTLRHSVSTSYDRTGDDRYGEYSLSIHIEYDVELT
jgi:putative ATPase